jgi:hypothetical protein
VEFVLVVACDDVDVLLNGSLLVGIIDDDDCPIGDVLVSIMICFYL